VRNKNKKVPWDEKFIPSHPIRSPGRNELDAVQSSKRAHSQVGFQDFNVITEQVLRELSFSYSHPFGVTLRHIFSVM
jgi:hypothetical protein